MILEKEISIYQPGAIGKGFEDVTDLADGKNSVFYQASPPATEGRKEGDVWYDSDGDNAMYKFDGTQWVLVQFGSNAIVAGSITAAKLNSQDVYTNFLLTNILTAAQAKISELSAVTANMGTITAGILKSTDYAYSSGNFASAGMAIDLNAQIIRMTHTALIGGTLYGENVNLSGKIIASTGEIGGFETDATTIHTKGVAVTENSNGSVALASADFRRTIDGTLRSGLRLAIADKFGVDNAGVVYASNGIFGGTIYASTGEIGGFAISSSAIHTVGLEPTSADQNSVALSSADFARSIDGTSRSGLRFAIGGKFGVANDGTTYASNIIAKGTIYATGGSINGELITQGIKAGNITSGTLAASVIGAGTITAAKLNAQDVYTNFLLVNILQAAQAQISTLSSVTANIGTVTAGKLQSADYSHTSGATYSTAGMLIDLTNKVIRTPKFAVGTSGKLYATDGSFNGSVTATSLEASKVVKIYNDDIKSQSGYFDCELKFLLENPNPAGPALQTFALDINSSAYVHGYLGVYNSLSVNGHILMNGNITADGTITSGGDITCGATNDSTRKRFVVLNSKGQASFRISNTGALGIYSETQDAWMMYMNSVGTDEVRFPHLVYAYGQNSGDKGPRPVVTCSDTEKRKIGYMLIPGDNSDSGKANSLAVNGQYAGATNFTTRYIPAPSSDIRLKTNIKDAEIKDALSLINSIKLHAFDWKDSGAHQRIGFVADELEELDKRLALGGGYDDNGDMDVKSVDTFYLLGYVVKALQEIDTKLNALQKGA